MPLFLSQVVVEQCSPQRAPPPFAELQKPTTPDPAWDKPHTQDVGWLVLDQARFGHCLRSFLGGHRTAHYKLPQFDAIGGYNAWQCITLHRIPNKGWRWYPTVICYGLLGYASSLPLHVELGSSFARLWKAQVAPALFGLLSDQRWQSRPPLTRAKSFVRQITDLLCHHRIHQPQIDRRKPYYIPSSLSLVGHGWLEKGTVYLSSIELPNCFRIVCLRLDGHHASRAGGNGAAVLGQLLEEARVSFWRPNLWSPFWYSNFKP